jgi:hypothetical protein
MQAQIVRLACVIGLSLLAAACVTPPTTGAMQGSVPSATIPTAPGAVSVRVTGGQPTSELEGANLSDADLKAAAEATLTRARAFQRVGDDPNARYLLSATIARVTRPVFGTTFTVEVDVGWSLLDRTQGKVLLRKGITTSGTATMSDAVVGATRGRMALEAAARANLDQLLRELSTLSY